MTPATGRSAFLRIFPVLMIVPFVAAGLCGQVTTWNGTTSSAWNTAANWSNGVPDQNTDAVIAGNTPFDPDTTGAAAVCRDFTVQQFGAYRVTPGSPLTIHGNCTTAGFQNGNGLVRMVGAGTHVIQGTALFDLEFAGSGSFALEALWVSGSLTVLSGTVRINVGINVFGSASFLGGTLAEGVQPGSLPRANFWGPTVFSGCTVTGRHLHVPYDTWTSDALYAAAPGSALVFIDGGNRTASVNGSQFFHIGIDTNTTVDFTGGPVNIGGGFASFGTVTPTSTLRFNGTFNFIPVLSGVLPNVEVASTGEFFVNDIRIVSGSFTHTSGIIRFDIGSVISVAGPATFTGGSIVSFQPTATILDLNGPTVFAGTSLGMDAPLIAARNSWTSDTAVSTALAVFFLQPSGTQTVSLNGSRFFYAGLAPFSVVDLVAGPLDVESILDHNGVFTPGSLVRFVGTNQPIDVPAASLADAEVTGTATLASDLVVGGSLTIASGASLDLQSSDLTVLGGALDVQGALSVGAGQALALGGSTTATVAASGSLSLLGTAGLPATVRGAAGGGYAFFAGGAITARFFSFRDMGPGGIGITPAAVFAAPPLDFRNGAFDFPAAAPGAAMLHVERAAATTFSYLDFHDTPATGAANVRALAGAAITMRNSGGAAAGPARETDPGSIVSWISDTTTLQTFSAVPGRELVTVTWSTSSEVDTSHFVLEGGPTATGPFTPLVQFPAAGPSVYQHIDQPLNGNQTYHYRLSEVLTFGPLRILGTRSACPWPATLPSSILTVGAGGAFADIQAAVNTIATSAARIISVAGGTYPAFTIDDVPGVDTYILIRPDGTGPVQIDNTAGPVRVRNLTLYDRVEISNVSIGSASAAHPAIVVENSTASIVLLESVTVTGGSGFPGLVVDASVRVALQRSVFTGTPGVKTINASMMIASRGSIDSLEIGAHSFVRTAQLVPGTLNLSPLASYLPFAGVMPDLDGPAYQPLGVPFVVDIEAEPGAVWFLGVSPALDWYDHPGWSMVGLFQIIGPEMLVGTGITNAVGTDSTVAMLPPEKILLGKPVPAQFVAYDTVAQTFRWSNVFTMIPMP